MLDHYNVAIVLEMACEKQERTTVEHRAMLQTAGELDAREIKPGPASTYHALVEESVSTLVDHP